VVSEQITSRNRLSTELQSASKLLVSVIGNSNPTETLREQQSALNAVVSMLNRYSSVSNLVVLEAPLANAVNDDRIGADALELANSFQIQFQIDKSAPDEV